MAKQGQIDNRTLVISDTGHDIPILDNLLNVIPLQGSFIIPEGAVDPVSQGRLQSQAKTWGKSISQKQAVAAQNNQQNGLFIGVEAHREKPINSSNLPNPEQLKGLGIDRVVVLKESSPKRNYTMDDAQKDLQPYLRKLSKSFVVETVGVDIRDN